MEGTQYSLVGGSDGQGRIFLRKNSSRRSRHEADEVGEVDGGGKRESMIGAGNCKCFGMVGA